MYYHSHKNDSDKNDSHKDNSHEKAAKTLINNYKNTKAEEDFNKLLHSLNSYINNTLMRVYGNIDEDVKSDTLMNITKWINNREENVGKYVVNQIIYCRE